jgi:UDPglucose 6-dehydrogenase
MTKFTQIGIIGHLGMVGGTTFRYFSDQKLTPTGFDLRDPQSDLNKVHASNIIFVCVPTPFNWTTNQYDDSIVDKVLSAIPDTRVVVIKSTVHIGTTEKFQAKYPKLKLLFNPEFLSEATCDNDFRHPDRQFVGFTDQSKDIAPDVLALLPKAICGLIIPSKQAELLKYINNMHGTLEIMEFNHFFEVCQKEGIDYDSTVKAASASRYFHPFYTVINHKGFRGFGGKCFPKDLNSWLQYLEEKGIDSTLFTAVRDMNRLILANQNLTEEEVEKK